MIPNVSRMLSHSFACFWLISASCAMSDTGLFSLYGLFVLYVIFILFFFNYIIILECSIGRFFGYFDVIFQISRKFIIRTIIHAVNLHDSKPMLLAAVYTGSIISLRLFMKTGLVSPGLNSFLRTSGLLTCSFTHLSNSLCTASFC